VLHPPVRRAWGAWLYVRAEVRDRGGASTQLRASAPPPTPGTHSGGGDPLPLPPRLSHACSRV